MRLRIFVMIRRIEIAVLLIASVSGWGQEQPTTSNLETWKALEARPAPLKCDRYEVATWGMKDGKYGEMCAPIMHTVTEKEWKRWLEVQRTQQEVNNALKAYILDNDAQRESLQHELKALRLALAANNERLKKLEKNLMPCKGAECVQVIAP